MRYLSAENSFEFHTILRRSYRRGVSNGDQHRIKGHGERTDAHAGRDERGAVGLKSGERVANSRPVLRRPTTPATAGRKPVARPPVLGGCAAAPIPQPKSWPGCGDRVTERIARERGSASVLPPEPSAGREASALDHLDSESVSHLRGLFELLDRWDREATNATKIV
jgi:hypothetical protein